MFKLIMYIFSRSCSRNKGRRSNNKKDALEIIVEKDNGHTIVVVQEADVLFNPGDRVRIITGSDGTTRVSK